VLALDRDVASLTRDDPAREDAIQRYARDMRRHFGARGSAGAAAVPTIGLEGGVEARDMIRRYSEDLGEDPRRGGIGRGGASVGGWPGGASGDGGGGGLGGR